jgi:hypothetical protein
VSSGAPLGDVTSVLGTCRFCGQKVRGRGVVIRALLANVDVPVKAA